MPFVKKRARASPKKRRVYHRAASAVGSVRRHFISRGGGWLHKLLPIGVGAAGQVAATVGNSFMSPWGGIAGLAGVGVLADNETLKTLAGMHLAAQVPLPGITTAGGGGGGGTNWL